jgi:CBS domain-containing protein
VTSAIWPILSISFQITERTMTFSEIVLGVVAIRLTGIVLAVLILRALADQQTFPMSRAAAAPVARSAPLPKTSTPDDDVAQILRDMRLYD